MPNKETHIAARDSHGIEVYYHQSSLPSREVVEAYENFHKGAAKIMLDIAVAEQEYEHLLGRSDAKLIFVTRILGMVFGFVLTLALLAFGGIMIYTGHGWGGYPSIIIAIISVITTLALGGRQPPQSTSGRSA